MNWPTKAELLAFGRNVGSAIGPLVAVGIAMTMLTPDQGQQIIASFNHIWGGILEIKVGLVGLAFLVPVALGWWAKMTASNKSQVQAVAAIPGTVVVTTPALADATPEQNIVSNTSVKVLPK